MINTLSRFFKQSTVLIVEDDYSSALLLREYILQLGAKTIIANSYKEAKGAFKNIPDLKLVLLDIRLGDGCGLELAEYFRRNNSEVIIIAQTALAIDEDIMRLKSGCFDSYLIKPITERQLFASIHEQIPNE
ncbi:MAG: response regulator [Bacteroidales bacterium]